SAMEASQPKNPLGGSGSFKSAMGLIGANPDNFQAVTPTEKLARAAGYGAVSVAAPEFALSKGATLASNLIKAGKGAAVGASSGVGGEVAADAVPEPFKPAARVLGGLAGGVGGAMATEAPAAVRAAGGAVARSVGPITDAGAQRITADRLASSATDLPSARAA